MKTFIETQFERLRGTGWPAVALLVLAATGVFAYHRLGDYNPTGRVRNAVEGAEGFFFSTAGSPTLLLIVAAWLLYRRHARLQASMRTPPGPLLSAIGLALLGTAALLGAWAHYIDALGLLIPSISLVLLGGGLFLGGTRGARALLLPALFLVLAFPHPAVLQNWVIYPMQIMTAEGSTWILDLMGVRVVLLGDLIFTGGKVFQVIETCAGLRATEVLIMASVVYTEAFHRTGPRRALLVLLSPIVGFLTNQLRVLTIIFNPYSSISEVHSSQGIAMMVVGVLLLAGLDGFLGRVVPDGGRPAPAPRPARGQGATPRAAKWRAGALSSLFVAMGTASLVLPGWSSERSRGTPLFEIPIRLGEDWRAGGLPLDTQFFGSVGVSEWVHRDYRSGESTVDVFVASDNRLEPRVSLISRKTEILGAGYDVLSRDRVEIGPEGTTMTRLLLRSQKGLTLAYHWYSGIESTGVEILRSALALDRGPWRRPGRSIVVRVSTALPADRALWPEAEARLGQVTAMLKEELDRIADD